MNLSAVFDEFDITETWAGGIVLRADFSPFGLTNYDIIDLTGLDKSSSVEENDEVLLRRSVVDPK